MEQPAKPTLQEIVVIHRTDTSPAHSGDKLEQAAKVLSLVAIPVLVAFFGWLIQDTVAKRSVSQEYVKLAVSILTESKEKADPALRDWAVDLLGQNSPTRFSPAVTQQLKSGQVNLPQLGLLLNAASGGASLAVSPDGRIVATGSDDGSARLWDIVSGHVVRSFGGHTAPVTSVVFSPDGRVLFTGSLDKTVKAWDVSTGKEIRRMMDHTNGVIGLAISPDGKTLLSRSLDGTVSLWSLDDGRLLSVLHLPR
jgi:WD40 repeat protein